MSGRRDSSGLCRHHTKLVAFRIPHHDRRPVRQSERHDAAKSLQAIDLGRQPLASDAIADPDETDLRVGRDHAGCDRQDVVVALPLEQAGDGAVAVDDYGLGDRGGPVLLGHDPVAVEGDGLPVAQIGPGAIVGERAVVEKGARTATVRAITPCQVVRVPRRYADERELSEIARGHRREEG